MYYDKLPGSEITFQTVNVYGIGYISFLKNYMLGIRLGGSFSSETTPFYMRSYVDLRGIPVLRYQGKSVYVAESEIRWDFTYRWSLGGFAGVGATQPVKEDISEGVTVYNYGLGLRYFIARLMGIRMGFDVVRGSEDWTFYIQFGSSWMKY